MIYITDRTLSALDDMPYNVSDLARFLELLIKTEPDAIELSQKMFHLLSPLPDYPNYIVRLDNIEDAAKYSCVSEFVCRNAPADCDKRVTCEILLENVQEIFAADCCAAACLNGREKIRIQGLDNLITEDYLQAFEQLRKNISGEIEFCPTNRYNFATALAAEWLISSETNSGAKSVSRVVTSFGGIGSFAPTEEVIMILKLAGLRKAEKVYDFFPEMADLLGRITASPVPCNKPVLGSRIFHVESGIHVDGILKDPKSYEPFPPETVGLKREIVIGKQSGTASIKTKLAELGISCPQEKISAILEEVRLKSVKKNGALTDEEFEEIAKEYAA